MRPFLGAAFASRSLSPPTFLHGLFRPELIWHDPIMSWEHGELFWFQFISHILIPQRYLSPRNGDSFITSPLGNVFPTGWAFQRFSLTLKRSHYRTDTSFSGSGNPFVFWFYALGFFVFLSIGFITVLDAKQK